MINNESDDTITQDTKLRIKEDGQHEAFSQVVVGEARTSTLLMMAFRPCDGPKTPSFRRKEGSTSYPCIQFRKRDSRERATYVVREDHVVDRTKKALAELEDGARLGEDLECLLADLVLYDLNVSHGCCVGCRGTERGGANGAHSLRERQLLRPCLSLRFSLLPLCVFLCEGESICGQFWLHHWHWRILIVVGSCG